MEHPRYVLYRLTHRLYEHFRENRATRLQIGILALVFSGLEKLSPQGVGT